MILNSVKLIQKHVHVCTNIVLSKNDRIFFMLHVKLVVNNVTYKIYVPIIIHGHKILRGKKSLAC